MQRSSGVIINLPLKVLFPNCLIAHLSFCSVILKKNPSEKHTCYMKNVIFLGGLFPMELRSEIEQKSSGVVQYAADALQWNLVEGLDFYLPELKIINFLFIGSYPKRYKQLRIKSSFFSHNKGSKDINVGFINLTGFKLFSRYFNAKRVLENHLNSGNEIILIYAIHTSLVLSAVNLKKRNPSVKICLIVPDLPEFMSDNNALLRGLKKIEKNILNKALEKIDAFVILSDHMVAPLRIKGRPWVRIEGIFNPKEILNNVEKEQFKTILYTGTLARRYGIVHLLNAFTLIKDQKYRLWICGDGDARYEVNARARMDPRITNFSQISREKVLILQKKATVLVNPRKSEGVFTKYSFPSKTMEYLASGTPCIIHRLDGIPTEYFEYCFICHGETNQDLSEMITSVCEKSSDELKTFGEKAKQFILNNKTPNKQAEKIYHMLELL